MKIKAIDVIGVAIIVVGVVMTVLLYFGNRQAPFDIEPFTIDEIPSPQQVPPAHGGARPL